MGVNRQNITPFGHLDEGHLIAGTKVTFPGVRGKLVKSIVTEDGTTLAAGSAVIIQPLNRNSNETPTFIITPYQQNEDGVRSDQMESRRNIISEKGFTIKLEKPEQFLKFSEEHFRRSHDILFPKSDSPSLEEINQIRIPDCFLLAAIQSIINHPDGKSFIRGMMRQNDDGTTTVRLFDPVTLKPEYIRVENSIMVDSYGEINQHRALWVHILEKAYAARGKKNTDSVDSSISSVYSGGGHTSLALQSLTGLKTNYLESKLLFSPLQIEDFLSDHYLMVSSLLANTEITSEQITNYLMLLEQPRLSAICDFFGVAIDDEEAKQQALNKYVELIKCHKADSGIYAEAIQQRSVEKLKSTYPEVAAILNNHFTKVAFFSGNYTSAASDVYNNIKNGLAQGQLITAGTHTKFEDKVVGLVGQHAYTVLGVKEKAMRVIDQDGKEKSITAKFIQVRNPWGNMDGFLGSMRKHMVGGVGRTYKQHKETLDVTVEHRNEATFYVELNDFCKYFLHYDISDSANNAFQRDAKKESATAEITKFIDECSIDFTNSHNELIETHKEYQKQLTKLIDIELMELNKLDAYFIQAVNDIFNENFPSELEKIAISGLLSDKEKLFPTVSGNIDDVKDHIYSLLKLNWIKSQDNQDKNFEAKLINNVKLHAAQPELWEGLSQVNMMLDTVVSIRANSYHQTIDDMETLSASLLTNLEKLKKLTDSEMETNFDLIKILNEQLINNFIKLEELYHQFLNLDLLVRKFYYSNNNDEYLVKFANILQRCSAQIKPVIASEPLFEELWQLRNEIRSDATNLEQKHEITPKENEAIQHATNFMFSGELKQVGEKLLGSSQSRNDIGKKLIKANSLVNKIKNLFAGIKSFFTKVAGHVSTFFHVRNSYEVPAIASASNKRTLK